MNVLIASVGGQGAILASRILGKLGMLSGQDVKEFEIHGMAQRGGRVVTHLRIGKKVFSPSIEKGAADIVLGFELLEGFRYADHLHADGMLIVNTHRIEPMPVLTGEEVYPMDLLECGAQLPVEVWSVNATDLAREAGHEKAANMVLLGMLSVRADFDKDLWIEVIRSTVPPKTVDINLRAFEAGRNRAKSETAIQDPI